MPNPAWVGRLNSISLALGAAYLEGLTSCTTKRTNRAPTKERCFIPESPGCNKDNRTLPEPVVPPIFPAPPAGPGRAGICRSSPRLAVRARAYRLGEGFCWRTLLGAPHPGRRLPCAVLPQR